MMTKYYFAPSKDKSAKCVAKKLAQRQFRKRTGYAQDITYMLHPLHSDKIPNYDDKIHQMRERFARHLRNGDVIEINGHGLPWIISDYEGNAVNEYNPFSLALFISEIIKNQDIDITIDLRSCFSGVITEGDYGDICFARDFSRVLSSYGFHNIKVRGYTGSINVNNSVNISVSAAEDLVTKGSKLGHCSAEDGSVEYCNGIMVKQPKKILIDKDTYNDKECRNSPELAEFLLIREDWYPSGLSDEKRMFLMHCQDPTQFADIFSPDESEVVTAEAGLEVPATSSACSSSSSGPCSSRACSYLSDSEDDEIEFTKTFSMMYLHEKAKLDSAGSSHVEKKHEDYFASEFRMG